MSASEKINAAVELLNATKRNIQLLDEHLEKLQSGRSAVVPADDVSSEHRSSFLGVADDLDQGSGIFLGLTSLASNFGWENPHTGTIRNEQDAAFVCTSILCTWGTVGGDDDVLDRTEFEFISEAPYRYINNDTQDIFIYPFLRLVDGSSGKNLITGMTEGPKDLDRGAVPFGYISGLRAGLGSNFRNALFSEFTIPRSGIVRAEVFNMGTPEAGEVALRALVTLVGYKVYGG